jgi:hypothetical protein
MALKIFFSFFRSDVKLAGFSKVFQQYIRGEYWMNNFKILFAFFWYESLLKIIKDWIYVFLLIEYLQLYCQLKILMKHIFWLNIFIALPLVKFFWLMLKTLIMVKFSFMSERESNIPKYCEWVKISVFRNIKLKLLLANL